MDISTLFVEKVDIATIYYIIWL